jgi:altronate dehydratase large subunit
MKVALRYYPDDNVVTTLEQLEPGDRIFVDGEMLDFEIIDSIPVGHKVASAAIAANEYVVKFGQPIGKANRPIKKGQHVHTHNVADLITNWREHHKQAYEAAVVAELPEIYKAAAAPKLRGYRRKSGKVGFRNHLLVLSAVVCANQVVQKIGEKYPEVIALTHGTGCVILDNETELNRITFLSMARNPNVGAVIFVGLGCEHTSVEWLAEQMEGEKPVTFVNIQDEGSSVNAVTRVSGMVEEMMAILKKEERTEVPVSELIVGTKCGGSDWTSSVVSNPTIGFASDMVVKAGGTSLLGETQGWFGAESVLIKRTRKKATADKIMSLLNAIYDKAIGSGRRIEEGNPSPGNKKGGITTLNEKALGNVKKGGTAPVEGALNFGEKPAGKGLYVLDNPSLDPISVLGLTCSDAQIVCFSTGRGTPTGTPLAPVIKVSASPHTCATFSAHLDIDLSGVITGKLSIEEAGRLLFDEIVAVANGKLTKSEQMGHREFTMPLLMGTM